jgi:hypothetical protein
MAQVYLAMKRTTDARTVLQQGLDLGRKVKDPQVSELETMQKDLR